MNGFLPMRNCCYFSRTGLKKQERVSGNVACGALRVSLKFLPWAQALGALLLCTSFTAFSKSAWMPFKWYVEVVLSMWVLVQNQPLPQVFSRWVICERRARSLRCFWSCERDVCARADLTWCPRNALSFWLFFLTQISSKYGLGLNKFVFLELRRLQKKFWLQLTVVARGEQRQRTT